MRRYFPTNQSGLTALEVLVVLVLIGIISVVIISRTGNDQTKLLAQTEVLKAHIRYAQSRSMSTNRIWGIEVSASGQWYALFDSNPAAANRRKLPGEESNTVDIAQHNLSLTPDSTLLYFNHYGSPVDGSGVMLGDTTLTLASGSESTNIIITHNTGFIQ